MVGIILPPEKQEGAEFGGRRERGAGAELGKEVGKAVRLSDEEGGTEEGQPESGTRRPRRLEGGRQPCLTLLELWELRDTASEAQPHCKELRWTGNAL